MKMVGIERQERESRAEVDFGGSSVNSHDADASRSYFIENLGGGHSFGPFNLGHLYKCPFHREHG